MPEESKASKDAVSQDAVSQDAVSQDAVSQDAVSQDAEAVHALSRVLPAHGIMDNACEALSAAHRQLAERCQEFETLLDAPEISLGTLRHAQMAVRAAGMKSMGVTTEYLTQLNRYMQILETASAERTDA